MMLSLKTRFAPQRMSAREKRNEEARYAETAKIQKTLPV
jgi:hypothetical protein